MNRGRHPIGVRVGGYTIVETLIFLAVSAAMFVSAMLLVNGQQNKTQFVNAVRDLETRLTDTANDIATGYYQNSANFACEIDGLGKPSVPDATSADKGSNKGCMLVGVALKFNNNAETYDQYSVAGARTRVGTDELTSTLAQAQPQVVYKTDANTIIAGAVAKNDLLYGATIKCVKAAAGDPCNTTHAAIGFFARLNDTGNAGSQGSGVQTDIGVYPTVDSAEAQDLSVNKMNAGLPTIVSSSDGLIICLKSGTTNQHALIHLGGNGGNGSYITSEIISGDCS